MTLRPMTAAEPRLSGIFVPIITPMDEVGELDLASLRQLAERCLREGASGLVALGSTGEPATLSTTERDAVVALLTEICQQAGRRLIVGVGGNDTAATAREVERRSAAAGVDAILSVVPYYTRPSPTGIVEHFRTLAKSAQTPLLLYNVPARTGVRLSAERALELAREQTIVGIKQSVGVLDEDTAWLLANAPRDFAVLAGDDFVLLPMLCAGASGGITASAHLCTSKFVALANAVFADRTEEARRQANELARLCGALFAEPNPSVLKGALAARGEIGSAQLRLPLVKASRSAVTSALEALEAIEQLSVAA